ncbi:hypothetical protein M2281_005782 [Mesorhizobium soli]|uniref:twin-arginine translocation signal domain-containing protein n=1 Tax=Pseudaminobacter soli (ex Li et al. 2025) TaxID=1295366 RepID=UPI0024731DA5|nr:twin-arginine translocation signal domain-containing protein [Mesorhizobium soli]MDH6235160.1 hypothetical protein [Mesorhizobium soli]
MSITRRLFLRHTAAVGATVAIPLPVAAEPQPTMTPDEQVRWHLNEAHRLMEQITGHHYDAAIEEDFNFALLIQRDKPSKWHAAPSSDGRSETVFCTYPLPRGGGRS